MAKLHTILATLQQLLATVQLLMAVLFNSSVNFIFLAIFGSLPNLEAKL